MLEFIAGSVAAAVLAAMMLKFLDWFLRAVGPWSKARSARRRLKKELPGASAALAVRPLVLEIRPVGRGTSKGIVEVVVRDRKGRGLNGVRVALTTDNGQLTPSELETGNLDGREGIALAVLEVGAGSGLIGGAHVEAFIERRHDTIGLATDVVVLGPTAETGLTLQLIPKEVECGETLLARVSAVDAIGRPVADGTVVYIATDSAATAMESDIVTLNGEAATLVATDPQAPGLHSVIAYVMQPDVNGKLRPSASDPETYVARPAPSPPPVSHRS